MLHETDKRFTFQHCLSCGSAFLKKPVNKNEVSKYYPDWYLPFRGADAWGKFSFVVRATESVQDKKRVKTCLKYFKKDEKIHVLDIGCGKPSFLAQVNKKTNWDLTGIDFKIMDAWKESKEYSSLDLIDGELENTSFDKKFDLITMWHYLEHDYHPDQALARVEKLLNPGGVIIVEVPDFQSLTRKWQGEHWEGWHTPRHTVLYHPESWSTLFNNAGIDLHQRYRYGTLDPFVLYWMGIMEKKNIDWSKNMETEFPGLVVRKIITFPLFALSRFIPLGIQTAIGRKPLAE